MSDLMANAQAWLAGKLKSHLSREVVYFRGIDTVTVRATIGSTLLKLSDEFGGTQTVRTDRDFLITTADLSLSGQLVEPHSGDRIRETVDGVTWVYEVLQYGAEPLWRWSDPHRNMRRIHTKQIGRE